MEIHTLPIRLNKTLITMLLRYYPPNFLPQAQGARLFLPILGAVFTFAPLPLSLFPPPTNVITCLLPPTNEELQFLHRVSKVERLDLPCCCTYHLAKQTVRGRWIKSIRFVSSGMLYYGSCLITRVQMRSADKVSMTHEFTRKPIGQWKLHMYIYFYIWSLSTTIFLMYNACAFERI